MDNIKVGDLLYRVDHYFDLCTFILQEFKVIKVLPTQLDIQRINVANPGVKRILRKRRQGGPGIRQSPIGQDCLEDFSPAPADAVAVVRKRLERGIRSARRAIEFKQGEIKQLETDLPMAAGAGAE